MNNINQVVNEVREALKCASMQESKAIACTEEWLSTLLSAYEEAQREIEIVDEQLSKYHKLHDEQYNEIRILEEMYEKAKASVFKWGAERDRVLEDKERLRTEHAAMKSALEKIATQEQIGRSFISETGAIAESVLSNLSKEQANEDQ